MKGDEALGAGHGLAVAFDEFGLVVKRIDLADRSGAEDHQHALGTGLEVGEARGVGVCRLDVGPDGGRGGGLLAPQQVGEGDAAEARGRVSEKIPPV